ncbi:MAG: hypothetical protein GC151_08640 [Betaproteobacteria bacterium]|nr:hypothetical protein [Betaproteobacteria bacterium]
MWHPLRGSRLDEALIAVYLGAIFVGAHLGSRAGWAFAAGVAGTAGTVGWIKAYRRLRHVKDIPTARVASAHQGYVELFGKADRHEGRYLASKFTARPCVWFRFVVEEKTRDGYKRINSGESDDTFLLRDDSGTCVIDPDHATVIPTHRRTWKSQPYRYTETWIAPGDPLYALGWFTTLHGGESGAFVHEEVSGLLTQWKQDRRSLLARFDSNEDGEIDMREWEEARKAARAEVLDSQRRRAQLPGLNVMRRPDDGRAYLLSAKPPDELTTHLARWTGLHFAAAVAGCIGAAAVLFVRFTQ